MAKMSEVTENSTLWDKIRDGKVQRVARTARTRLQNSGIGWTKSSTILTRASMLRSYPPIRCGMTTHRIQVGYANFYRLALKSVAIATSLERS